MFNKIVILVLVALSFGVPEVSAGTDVCVALKCAHVDTETVTQTQTCGGSGNIIVNNGNNNTYNVCSQNQTSQSTKRFAL